MSVFLTGTKEIRDHELLEAIQNPLIATSVTGQILYWNKPAEAMYGWKREEVMGRNIVEVTPSNQNAEQSLKIMKMLQNGQVWSGEIVLKKKSGEEFSALVTDSPIINDAGTLVGLVGMTVDITVLKNIQKRLEEKNRELEKLNHLMIGRELRMADLKKKLLSKGVGNS
jgi:PAS domain S-box-containing protein